MLSNKLWDTNRYLIGSTARTNLGLFLAQCVSEIKDSFNKIKIFRWEKLKFHNHRCSDKRSKDPVKVISNQISSSFT